MLTKADRTTVFFSLLVLNLLPAGCSLTERSRSDSTAGQAVPAAPVAGHLTVVSWNIRGYPEKDPANTDWIHGQLAGWCPDVLCIQEIANPNSVQAFRSKDARLRGVAFQDSRDGMDNAIFTAGAVTLQDLPDPEGFQHPPQAALIALGGCDAVLVTVHLSWTNRAMRESEMALLRGVVQDMTRYDPDVMLAGDFNLREQDIEQLARSIGMVVMVPAGQEGVGTTQAGNRYDHFLISSDLAEEEAMGCQIQTFTGSDQAFSKRVSDHLPITAWFKTDARFRDRRVN